MSDGLYGIQSISMIFVNEPKVTVMKKILLAITILLAANTSFAQEL